MKKQSSKAETEGKKAEKGRETWHRKERKYMNRKKKENEEVNRVRVVWKEERWKNLKES